MPTGDRSARSSAPKYKVKCRCGNSMRVRPRHVGRMCRCTRCGNPIYVTYDTIRPRPNLYDKKLPRMFDEDDVPVYWKKGDLLMELYEVREVLDSGGMATVYRIRHRAWDMDLAVKFPKPELIPDENWMELFEQECRTWMDLPPHPHVVECHYVRRLGGMPRVFMEFVRSTNLNRLIRTKDFYSDDPAENLPRMLDTLIQFAWGIGFAHAQGVIHQDVKPPNLLIRPNGNAKVTDFGLARLAPDADGGERQGTFAQVGGTPIYRAPEQTTNDGVCVQTDMWGWGLSAMELFAGGIIWRDSLHAKPTLDKFLVHGSTFDYLPKMSPELGELLRRCFASDPAKRPESMQEIADALIELYKVETGAAYRRNNQRDGASSPAVRNNRAVSLLDLDNRMESERIWKELLDDEPDYFPARFNRDLYLWRSGRLTDATMVERARDYVDEAPEEVERKTLLARILMERGDIQEAIDILAPMSAAHPDDRDLAFAYAMVQSLEGRNCEQAANINIGAPPLCLAMDDEARRLFAGFEDGQLGSVEFGLTIESEVAGRHKGAVTHASLTEDQKRVVSGAADGSIALWNPAERKTEFALNAHSKQVTALAVSVSGRNIASASATGTVRVWDVDAGESARTLSGKAPATTALTFSRCGAFLLAGRADGSVVLWDIWNGAIRYEFAAARAPVVAVHLNADTTQAVVGSGRYIEKWELESQTCAQRFAAHEREIKSLSVADDLRFAVSATADYTTKCWNLDSGQCMRSLKLRAPVALTRNGRYLCGRSVRNRVEIWSVYLDVAPFGSPYTLARRIVGAATSDEDTPAVS